MTELFKITGPGDYLARNGQKMMVLEFHQGIGCWLGKHNDIDHITGFVWRPDGAWSAPGMVGPYDLVSRLSKEEIEGEEIGEMSESDEQNAALLIGLEREACAAIAEGISKEIFEKIRARPVGVRGEPILGPQLDGHHPFPWLMLWNHNTGWRPIETAPQDGTFVLITDGETAEVAQSTGNGWWARDGLDFGYGEWDKKLTYWRPLDLPKP